MAEERDSNNVRILALAALAVFAVLFLIVVASSGVDDKSSKSATANQSGRAAGKSTGKQKTPRKRAGYTVKPGDSLGTISEKTGVTLEQLQTLNPDVDPQALSAGTKLKLR